jgi:Tfp pilus assembly protein PilO
MFIRNKQQMIILAAASAVILACLFGFFLPLNRKAGTIRSQRDIAQLIIDEAIQQKSQLPQLKQKLQTLSSQVKNYQSSIPEEIEVGQFLQTITSLMDQYNLQEQFVKPGDEKRLEQLLCVPIDIRCKGRLSQLFEFFKSLQSLDRLVRIEFVNLSNSPNMDGQLSMETKAVIYYKGQKAKS